MKSIADDAFKLAFSTVRTITKNAGKIKASIMMNTELTATKMIFEEQCVRKNGR